MKRILTTAIAMSLATAVPALRSGLVEPPAVGFPAPAAVPRIVDEVAQPISPPAAQLDLEDLVELEDAQPTATPPRRLWRGP